MNRLERVGTIWSLAADQPVPRVDPLVQARFQRVGPEEIEALARAAESDRTENISGEIMRRFEAGRECFAAWVGERLAAYGWVSVGEENVGELDLSLTILPGEAYIWDCFTLPEFRQKHLYSALLVYILNQLRVEECLRVWIGADYSNHPSQRGIDRAGFQRVADLGFEPGEGTPDFVVIPYPGVPQELVRAAARLFLSKSR